ncbi:hypothetical protein [Delftia tsuruhatensis]|uniref:Morphogenetic protein n=1 Tax=Delftia tsuruhatensis TaxID=180282 RepID=A0ABM6DZA6_9BURK|nr:hypothetical protein [Delftia tsuruhatensis]AOV00397.1 hypothetical protein BI380_02985 [Delftia tsuruhatensis]
MQERPILFSAPMVLALLAGTKTQTRRVAKEFAGRDDLEKILRRFPNQNGCPYGQPGDRLWVREAFRFPASLDHLSPSVCGDKALDAGYRTPWAPTQFEADGSRTGEWRGFDTPPEKTRPGKLRPGIHMPRWASRISLEITALRAERLQDISDADARAEGIEGMAGDPECGYRNYLDQSGKDWTLSPRESFQSLWESINGPASWAKNPWVWVVEFERAQAQQKGPAS